MQPTTFHGLVSVLVTALTNAYRTEDEATFFAATAVADRAFGALMRLIADQAGLGRPHKGA